MAHFIGSQRVPLFTNQSERHVCYFFLHRVTLGADHLGVGGGGVISGDQEFFFLATWWAGYFFHFFSHKLSITFVLHAIFFFRQALAAIFFFKITPSPLKR